MPLGALLEPLPSLLIIFPEHTVWTNDPKR